MALIILDIDEFKAINDEIGHLQGNMVLSEVAKRVLADIRAADIACRIGGDEFGVILPESNGNDAHLLAERVVSGVLESATLRMRQRSPSRPASASCEDGDTANDLFARADKDLYSAKDARKDQPRLRKGR